MIRRMRKMVPLLATMMTTAVTIVSASIIVSESGSRLPMSLSTVISDLEAEGMAECSTACLITTRSVTAAQKQSALDVMLGRDDHLVATRSKAVATAKGLALAIPSMSLLDEVVQSTIACQGLVIFIPSSTDLSRGEGVMDALGPAMERLVQWQQQQQATTTTKQRSGTGSDDSSSSSSYENKSCLVVVCDSKQAVTTTPAQLEAAAAPILATFSSSNSNDSRQQQLKLNDVFGSVLYLTAQDVEAALLNHAQRPQQTTTPEDAMALVATVVADQSSTNNPSMMMMDSMNMMSSSNSLSSKVVLTTPLELAAARQLEPAKRAACKAALEMIDNATAGNTKLVPSFGALCDAILQQAKDQLFDKSSSSSSLQTTTVGRELSFLLQHELASEWMDSYERQLALLQDASFASFTQSLGKLRLGPTLAADMDKMVRDCLGTFATSLKGLASQTAKNRALWKTRGQDATVALARRLHEFCRERLQAAEASGQFKPIPRKGVTIGFHWLLPKPFGNDYRQEPWMVHATDHLVYVPRRSTKVTDVPAENVLTTGDWRDQVVPSPAGKDMLYMQ